MCICEAFDAARGLGHCSLQHHDLMFSTTGAINHSPAYSFNHHLAPPTQSPSTQPVPRALPAPQRTMLSAALRQSASMGSLQQWGTPGSSLGDLGGSARGAAAAAAAERDEELEADEASLLFGEEEDATDR